MYVDFKFLSANFRMPSRNLKLPYMDRKWGLKVDPTSAKLAHGTFKVLVKILKTTEIVKIMNPIKVNNVKITENYRINP